MIESQFEDTLPACGYCGIPCLEGEINKHICIRIFNEFFIEDSHEFFWGVDTNGEAVYNLAEEQQDQLSGLHRKKENCSNIKEQKLTKKEKQIEKFNAGKHKLDQEEQLILEVQKRPPLWDFALPIEERSRSIKQHLWKEVSASIKGSFTPAGAKKKMKSLIDVFRNIIKNEKFPSGSANSQSTNQKWAHYHTMEFLRSKLSPRRTVSNCETFNEVSNEYEEEFDSSNELFEDLEGSKKKTSSRCKRKRLGSDNDMLCESFTKVAEAISSTSTPIMLPPPPPPVSEIETCLSVVACRLKKIPEKFESEATQDILNYSMEVLKKYSNQDIYYQKEIGRNSFHESSVMPSVL